MFAILIFVAVCGAVPLQKNISNVLDQNHILLQNDTNLFQLQDTSDEDKYVIVERSSSEVHSYLVNLLKSAVGKKVRRKRFIARSGTCPDNQVMMPKPIGCITCEE